MGRVAADSMITDMSEIAGGVTAAAGWQACGMHAGIKASDLDVAVLRSDTAATLAGVFTRNAILAAPVLWCKELVQHGHAQAVVVNSGCANACTGPDGVAANRLVAEQTAAALGLAVADVAVCSTGTIGKPLPVEKISSALQQVSQHLSRTGGGDAARAILTTDTVPKESAVEITLDGHRVRVGGMAKGSGMIAPNLATMLAFLTTDAQVAPQALQACLTRVAHATFNRITVDGDTSTNDTVLLLANGAAGTVLLDETHPEWHMFEAAVAHVADVLAKAIVQDGEGATRFVTITVAGARSVEDATRAAKAIANSLLCKTAWFGGDPNWGRVVCAVGYSGASVDPERIAVAFDEIQAVCQGQPAASFAELEQIVARPAYEIRVDLQLGTATDTVYTCDCSYDYVRINAEYMT